MNLKQIIRKKFLPPKNENKIYNNFNVFSEYGILKIAKGIIAYLETDDGEQSFANTNDSLAFSSKNGGRGRIFDSVEEANEHCWEHFDYYYESKIDRGAS